MMGSRNRGRPKPKISDISRTPPTEEEYKQVVAAFNTELHPITEAVLAAAFVEHQLDLELRRYFPRRDDATWGELTSDIGPLRSFHAKITFAYAVKILDDNLAHNFHIVRNIRNQFAHANKLIDFDHPLIIKELRKVIPIPGFDKEHRMYIATNNYGYQKAYASLCVLLSAKLIKRETRSLKGKAKRSERKVKGLQNDIYSLRVLQSFLVNPNVSPSQKAPQG